MQIFSKKDIDIFLIIQFSEKKTSSKFINWLSIHYSIFFHTIFQTIIVQNFKNTCTKILSTKECRNKPKDPIYLSYFFYSLTPPRQPIFYWLCFCINLVVRVSDFGSPLYLKNQRKKWLLLLTGYIFFWLSYQNQIKEQPHNQ